MRSRAVQNGFWNVLSNISGAVMGMVGSILIVRSLTTAAYGEFSYYIWLAGLLSTLGTLSLPRSIVKVTSELRGSRRDMEAEVLSCYVAFIVGAVNLLLTAVLLVWATTESMPQRGYILLVAFALFPAGLSLLFGAILQGSEEYRSLSLVTMSASLLQLGVTLLAYFFHPDPIGFLTSTLSIHVFAAIGLLFVLRGRGPAVRYLLRERLPAETWRVYMAFALPLTVNLLTEAVVWARSEIFFLNLFSNTEQIGYYNLAYILFGILFASGFALTHGFQPAISRDYGAGNWPSIRRKMEQGIMLAVLYAVPLSFGGLVTVEGLIRLIYGEKMVGAALIAQILIVGLIPAVVSVVVGGSINAMGGVRITLRLGLLLATINIGLDLLLIPSYGAVGGALANLGAQTAGAVLLTQVLRRYYGIHLPWRKIAQVVCIGVMTTVVVPLLLRGVVTGVFGLALTIGIAGTFYILSLALLGHIRTFDAAGASI